MMSKSWPAWADTQPLVHLDFFDNESILVCKTFYHFSGLNVKFMLSFTQVVIQREHNIDEHIYLYVMENKIWKSLLSDSTYLELSHLSLQTLR